MKVMRRLVFFLLLSQIKKYADFFLFFFFFGLEKKFADFYCYFYPYPFEQKLCEADSCADPTDIYIFL